MNSPAKNALHFGLAALVAVAATGTALARPDTRAMTCAQTQNLIVRNGAVVLTTGRHTYDRYVAGAGYCSWPDVPTQTSVRTADTGHCPVYSCQRVDPIWDDPFGP